MEKNRRFSNLIFVLVSLIVFFFFGALIWVSSKESVMYSYDNPILTDSPIYEELSEGDFTTVYLETDVDKFISGITVLPVNLSPTGTGSLNIRVDASDNTVLFTKIDERDIKVGEWNRVPVTISLKKDKPAKVTITAVNCSPFFMYAPSSDSVDNGISVGMYSNTVNRNMLYAMIVKYVILAIALSIILIIKLSNSNAVLNKCGNDIFLAIVYIFICVGIYSASY